MRPDQNDKPKPSLDGMRPVKPTTPQPEYRYDHELPAPEPTEMLEDGTGHPDLTVEEPEKPKKKLSLAKKLILSFAGVLTIVMAIAIGAYIWYQQQLAPVTDDTTKRVKVVIESGSAPSSIAKQLKDAGVIRSQTAFAVYTKLTGTQNTLKAGAYSLQPSLSTPTIVDHLVEGKQDTFTITFLPGDTLESNRKKLIKAGYSESEVDAALNKKYDRPLFEGKPATADLEGYIFGDTYQFDASATPEAILERTFDEYEAAIAENDLVNGLKKQGLSLYQGITLASIVQREVTSPNPGKPNDDQRQVARVFLNRMAKGMTLGSDVTYQYIADKTGVERTPNLDSPYNTRRYQGLPPGPIAVPGVGALAAVASPGTNDYLFFLSGDDDVTYFGKTDADHQKNIAAHCQKKCLIN